MSDQPAASRFQAPRCSHVMANGLICRAPALKGEAYCYFHFRARVVRHCQGASPKDFAAALPILDSPENIQAAFDQTIHALAAAKLDSRRASIILRGLQLAAANLPSTHEPTTFEPSVVGAAALPQPCADPATGITSTLESNDTVLSCPTDSPQPVKVKEYPRAIHIAEG